MAELQA